MIVSDILFAMLVINERDIAKMPTRKSSKLAKFMSLPRSKVKHVPTKRQISYWFNLINKEVFDGTIPKFNEVEITRLHGAWGNCIGKGGTHNREKICNLQINHHTKSKHHLVEILAHEMVHSWQWHHLHDMDHGPTFFKWKPRLAKHGIPLSVVI